MRKPLSVGLVVAVAACVPCAAVQSPVPRAGVSVEMAVTQHAVPLPEADGGVALVIAITRKPTTYLEITPVTPGQLTEKLKERGAGRSSKNLFLKADARASYSSVAEALAAVRAAGIDSTHLLTSQQLPSDTPSYMVPKGLRVHIGAPSSPAIVVRAQGSAAAALTLTIGGTATTLDQFPADLTKLLGSRAQQPVVLQADGSLTFQAIIQIIDVCRGAGAEVFLATPGR